MHARNANFLAPSILRVSRSREEIMAVNSDLLVLLDILSSSRSSTSASENSDEDINNFLLIKKLNKTKRPKIESYENVVEKYSDEEVRNFILYLFLQLSI